MKIVFFGTSSFAVPTLEALVKNGLAPVLVVSTPDKPHGRGRKLHSPPVKLWALEHGLPVIQPDSLESVIKNEESWQNIDLIIVASYGKIIPKRLLDIPKYGALNIHPSLLPKYRGPSPIHSAILNGDRETGVTIMLMDEEMDHGPVIENSKFQITNYKQIPNLKSQIYKPTYQELERALAHLGAGLLIKIIPEWIAGKISPIEQNHAEATYTKKVDKNDGHINWKEPALIIERKIRAYYPAPGAYTFWSEPKGAEIRLKLRAAEVIPKPSEIDDGEVFITKESFAVGTPSGALEIKKIQQEGKEEITGESFLRGHNKIIGAILT